MTIRSPIERRKTYELVADRLTEEISSRTLSEGDLLPPERELVASFGVGRSSVREALRMLESRGLIESRGNGTFAVAPLRNALNHGLHLLLASDEADTAELFEVRRILEGETAALAATRRTQSDLRRMASAVAAMEEGLADEATFIDADLRFHLTLAEATRNRVVTHLMHAIRELLHRSLSSAYHIPGSPERAIELHRLILEAIQEKHPEEARQRMQEHVSRVERDIRGAQTNDRRRRRG
ncbi:MAG TPA: FadR/GntR family transcriptional regulator [Gaiellaceae bacterium]|nr:FadR/GntR family transcriptional regulator [Gaiellaceae bacterium]